MKPITWNGTDIYPSKIVCVGRNYVDHISEPGEVGVLLMTGTPEGVAEIIASDR